jgi:thiol-disulfide isomerase/thioredoxin
MNRLRRQVLLQCFAKIGLPAASSSVIWRDFVGSAQARSSAHAARFPNLVLNDSRGQAVRVGPGYQAPSTKTKLIYLDFWASWCGPCQHSFPWMQQLHLKFNEEGLFVLAINLDKQAEAAMRFLGRFHVDFTTLFDASGDSARLAGIKAMPSSFLLDSNWVLLNRHEGFRSRDIPILEEMIVDALKQNR